MARSFLEVGGVWIGKENSLRLLRLFAANEFRVFSVVRGKRKFGTASCRPSQLIRGFVCGFAFLREMQMSDSSGFSRSTLTRSRSGGTTLSHQMGEGNFNGDVYPGWRLRCRLTLG